MAPVDEVKEPEPNPDGAGGAANPNVPDTNIGTGGEPVEMGEDGTYTETPEDNTTTTQPPPWSRPRLCSRTPRLPIMGVAGTAVPVLTPVVVAEHIATGVSATTARSL